MEVIEEEEALRLSDEECSELQDRVQFKLMDLALQGRLHMDSHGVGNLGRGALYALEGRYCPGLVGSASPLAGTGRYTTLAFYLTSMTPADQHFLKGVLYDRMFERVAVTEHKQV